LLMESRSMLESEAKVEQVPELRETPPQTEMKFALSTPLSAISPPPPIATVLHDIYPDDASTTNCF
jgi:hypothetical protein